MMRTAYAYPAAIVLAAALASWPGTAGAERMPERKEAADYILTGRVEKVFKRQEGRRHEYVVLLAVREVHKGEGVKAGDAFYAYCFQVAKVPLVPVAEEGGHDAVPQEGQTVKAYVRHRGGRHEGNYSDWFEVVPDRKPDPR